MTRLSKGRRHGLGQYFSSSGHLERQVNFWYDQLHGLYREFWPNGRLALEASYTYGALERILAEYDEAGQLLYADTNSDSDSDTTHK